MNIEVLYEDNHLLCVVKPPMLPVQADASGDPDLLTLCKAYIKERYNKPGAVYLGLLHRLDRPVGGAIAFARTSKSAARMQRSMQAGLWDKSYLAVVCGDPPASGELRDHLRKDETTRTSTVVSADDPGAKEARLRYERLAQSQGLSLLRVRLDTGRHHQIRVQLASRAWPIWGDARYNPQSRPGQAIALFAAKLSFPHPTRGERIQLTAAPPDCEPWQFFSHLLKNRDL